MLIERNEEETHRIANSSAAVPVTCTDRKPAALGMNQRLRYERLYLRYIASHNAFLCCSHVAEDPDLLTCYTPSTGRQFKLRSHFDCLPLR